MNVKNLSFLGAIIIAGLMGCTATAQRTNQLNLGMTKQEVLQVMDDPVSTTARGNVRSPKIRIIRNRLPCIPRFCRPVFCLA